ncbi:MAG: glycosyltransferase family 9 protein [Verrucomicrobiota bacterium]
MAILLASSFRSEKAYAFARITEYARPLLRLLARILTGTPVAQEQWKRGVLLGCDHIGDVLYRTASLPALSRATPNCDWAWILGEPGGQIAASDPHVPGGIVRLPQELSATPFYALVQLLRAGRYDVVICYDTRRYWKLLLAGVLACIPSRVGYVHKGFSGLVTHPIAIRWPQPYACYFRDLVSQLAGERYSEQQPVPRVCPTAADETAAARWWKMRLTENELPVLACSFFSRQPRGNYPLSDFAKVLREVRASVAFVPIFICSAVEREKLEAFLQGERLKGIVLAGDLQLPALTCVLQRCAAAWIADSGIRHLANAAGIPVVFARNYSFRPEEAGRYLATETDVAYRNGRGPVLDLKQAASVLIFRLTARDRELVVAA